MAHTGRTGDEATGLPTRDLIKHRELIAAIFSPSVAPAATDPPSDIENEEIFHCIASQGIPIFLAGLPGPPISYDMVDRFGRTPLHWAAHVGHLMVVFQLLEAEASIDPRSHDGSTPIMLAASAGHAEIVQLLLRYRAGASDRRPSRHRRRGIEHRRSTALHCAAAGGHVQVVKALLRAGFDRGQQDGAGLTPVEVSARQRHSTSADTTRLLIPRGDFGGKLVYDYVNLEKPEVFAVSSLITSKLLYDYVNLEKPEAFAVSSLITSGAFLDWRDGTGDTPLHRAMHFDHDRLAFMLLMEGANPNIRGRHGTSPLHIAATTGCWQLLPALLYAGADPDLLSVSGDSALHLAVLNNRVEVVRSLLCAGASTEHRDPIHGQTPLSWACEKCFADIVKTLAEGGADVNSRSSAGLTPLHWACRFVDEDSVRTLVGFGANPRAVDRAAAKDAGETSSSRSGPIVSLPVAIDVVGLGYPRDRQKHPRLLSTGDLEVLASTPLNMSAVERITWKLRAACIVKQDNSWRRRGWLVILANRWVGVGVPGVRDGRAVGCRGCYSPRQQAFIQLQHVDTAVEQPTCAHQNRAAAGFGVDANMNNDSSDAQRPREGLSNGQGVAGKTPRSTVRSVGVMTRAAIRRKRRAQEKVADPLAGLVRALLGLAAVEVGVFHGVVRFI